MRFKRSLFIPVVALFVAIAADFIDVVRNALALVKIAQDARAKGQKLVIADANDKPLKEIVLS